MEKKHMYITLENINFVLESDYLKVVEENTLLHQENENWKESYKLLGESFNEGLKEKDEEMKEMTRLKDKTFLNLLELEKELEEKEEEIERLNKTIKYQPCLNCTANNGQVKLLEHEIKRLHKRMEYNNINPLEDTYTLIYSYYSEKDRTEKEWKQEGMLLEELLEVVGMDSHNWLKWKSIKEVR